MRFRLHSLLWILTLLGCGRTNEIAAIDDAGTASGGSSGSGNGGSGGSGGSGGVSGSETGGSGGTGATAAQDLTHYHGCELPTGAIRYGIYKTDPARDLCFQIVVSNTSLQFGEIQVTPEDFNVESAHVWQDASTCGNWPAVDAAVAATGGIGTIDVSPILTSPPQFDVDVTLAFSKSESWVPLSEPVKPGKLLAMGYDCATCAERASAYKTLIDETRQASAGQTCTSMLRFAFGSLELLSHQINCGDFVGVTEAQALATAETALGMAPGAASLAGSQAEDQFVFRGLDDAVIPEADRLGAAVNPQTGLLTFGVRMGWSTPGGVELPQSWRPGSELGGGCPPSQQPTTTRGFDLNDPNGAVLPASEIDPVVAKAFSTAMPQGILDSWGLAGMDAVVLRYSTKSGFDAGTAEYVVLVNHRGIVVN